MCTSSRFAAGGLFQSNRCSRDSWLCSQDEKLLALMQTLAEQQAMAMEQHKILLEKTTAAAAAQPPAPPQIILQAPVPPAEEGSRRPPSNPLHDRSVQVDLHEFEWKQPSSGSDSSSSERSRDTLIAQDVQLTVAEAVAKAVTNVADW